MLDWVGARGFHRRPMIGLVSRRARSVVVVLGIVEIEDYEIAGAVDECQIAQGVLKELDLLIVVGVVDQAEEGRLGGLAAQLTKRPDGGVTNVVADVF